MPRRIPTSAVYHTVRWTGDYGPEGPMCDVLVALADATQHGTVVFGKNSDRPVDDCQVLHHAPPRKADAGRRIRCTYVEVADAEAALATFGCRPYWCWGYETGLNEAGLVGGNAALFTRPLRESAESDTPLGLLGMDLLRLGLERSSTAVGAVEAIVGLLAAYGQWGSALPGASHRSGSYDNSFLLADRREAWVLETAGREWAAERVHSGVRSLSNEPTIRTAQTRSSADLEGYARARGRAGGRQGKTGLSTSRWPTAITKPTRGRARTFAACAQRSCWSESVGPSTSRP